jgi:rhamnose utilization protein RhaD (predicted bifunctional aldolase and dehydrogenase)/NAD(P)-dependent dehydrogenase (short-subunit alcohol dehydrogenase family)
MASSIQWPDFPATDTPMDVLVKLSHFYGADPDFVLAGGGNTSVKVGDRLFVKGSGHALATIPPEGFVEMDRVQLEALLNSTLSEDRLAREAEFKAATLAARVRPEKNQRPSVEALLHHLMPRQYVVHTHSTLVNMVTCCVRGAELARQLAGDVVWIGDVDPGYVLSRVLRQSLEDFKKATGRDCPRAVLMKNHGLVICGETPGEIREHTDWLVETIRKHFAVAGTGPAFGPVTKLDSAPAHSLLQIIGPALRGLLATGENLKIVTFSDAPEVMDFVGGAEGKAVATAGPLTPDQIVYCKSFPLWFETGADATTPALVGQLRQAIQDHTAKTGAAPHVILVKELGMFSAGDDFAAAETVRLVYTDAIKVMAGARRLGGIRYMDDGMRRFIEDWEVESYRKSVSAAGRAAGRVAGKVAIVTGAAQGFGLEISQDLIAQGATVVLTDVNAQGAQAAADRINAQLGKPRAIGLPINVADGASVAEAIHQVIRRFGGLDVFISNAGVLKAGSVKTQPEKDFDFVTTVNYKGYFVCVQQTAPVLATQHLARPDYSSDIIQINSKSGLVGSNRNGAYAGSKFGGIGLTQSFALELVEDGIKVNSICPGNFFDGPLWSDPQNGLFAQYLRSGKVPGAKTLAEVKRFYEAKVPMNRGCATADVVKAIYYLIEQKYETGQALPVTGGQVMLA